MIANLILFSLLHYKYLSHVLPAKHLNSKHGLEKEVAKLHFQKSKTKDLSKEDPNLKLQDEAEAYDKITVQAEFTTHPGINFSTLILLLALLIAVVQIITLSSM